MKKDEQRKQPLRKIVMVDEALHEIRPLVLDLRMRGVQVDTYQTADDCLNRELAYDSCPTDIFILDVMLLSSGHFTKQQTDNFLYTGLLLARVIREYDNQVPIIFFTSTYTDLGLYYVYKTIEDIGTAMMFRKHEIASPHEFGERIFKLWEEGIPKKTLSDVIRAILKSILLQPNIGGVGFDAGQFLKELNHR